MNDREMLESAAKAAGIAGHYVTNCNGVYYYRGNTEGILYECPNGRLGVWNPLTDDGDALRLAVDLHIDICFNNQQEGVTAWCGPLGDWIAEPLEPNNYAATRRAIVRAAAEIGRKHEH